MRKIIITLIATVVMSVGLVGLTSVNAQAAPDKRPCVTKGEWAKVNVGMKVAKVTRILDTRGYFTYRDFDTYYPNVDTYKYYSGCGKYKNSYLEINFYNGRVYSKDSVWTSGRGYRVNRFAPKPVDASKAAA